MKPTATVAGHRLRVAGDLRHVWRILAALPGAKWERGTWTYPATPVAADAIRRCGIVLDTTAGDLAAVHGERSARLAAMRAGAEPPEIDGLWRHQRAAVHVAELRAGHLLDYAMRSGKTRIALTIAARYARVLAVCPLKVIDTWPEQAAVHGIPVRVVGLKVGTVAERLRAAMGAGPCTIVTNYEAVWREPLGAWVLAQPWDLVIADEVHRLAAPGGRASRFMGRLAERVQHRIGLSGTPVGDGPGNAYGIFRFLDAAVFGTTAAAFQARYVNTIQLPNGARIPNPNPAKRYRNVEEFTARYNLITLKGDRDAADLPAESDTTLHCDLPPAVARIYASMRDELIAELRGGTITAANALVKATKLHQLAAGHIRHEDGRVEAVHGEKGALLAEVLDELGPAEPLVVFCWYRADLAAIEAVCRAAGVAYHEVSGGRDDLAAWRGGAGRVLAVQIQAGGVGVDLSRAVHAVYWTACFSHPLYVQSRARLLGQRRAVSFTHLVSRGTIDEAIYRALERKADVLKELLSVPESVRRMDGERQLINEIIRDELDTDAFDEWGGEGFSLRHEESP